ncbi:Holliday junction resolvase RuvX [Candidatus Shapirobacteria bacterium]|nr:Holliday junction resolvase RuvX [Candidatus Shapirobacteria bacterium]
MNLLSIDYGTKRIGLAYSTLGIISTLPPIPNDDKIFVLINKTITEYSIEKIFVGVSEGEFAKTTLVFVDKLRSMVNLEVETVEEAVSTIEATSLFKDNFGKAKNYKKSIDSVAAAVILRRVVTD